MDHDNEHQGLLEKFASDAPVPDAPPWRALYGAPTNGEVPKWTFADDNGGRLRSTSKFRLRVCRAVAEAPSRPKIRLVPGP